jgi:hypothetical protein
MTCAIVSSPTTSAVRNVALFARPSLLPVRSSTTSYGQPVLLRLLDRRQHAEDADAIGDEVRRVLRAHHALAERRGQETLEIVENLRRVAAVGINSTRCM